MIPIAIGNESNPDAGRDRWVFFNSLLEVHRSPAIRTFRHTCFTGEPPQMDGKGR